MIILYAALTVHLIFNVKILRLTMKDPDLIRLIMINHLIPFLDNNPRFKRPGEIKQLLDEVESQLTSRIMDEICFPPEPKAAARW